MQSIVNEAKEVVLEKPKTATQDKPKALKLSYKESEAINRLPTEVEALEEKIEIINNCLATPSCYEERGLSVVAQELSDAEALYEEKVEALLELEEKVEAIEAQK